VRNFACASSQQLRIFEGIIGIFQDAHRHNPLTIFEFGAHLRRALALHPVPIMLPSAQPRTSASFGPCAATECARCGVVCERRIDPHPIRRFAFEVQGFRNEDSHQFITDKAENGAVHSLPQALRRLSRFARMRAGPARKKTVPGFGTAPRWRD
jgi:hypothetical protein